MRLVVLGSAGSFPSADSSCSSYLVQADDEAGRTWSVLLDLGNGALWPLQRYWNVAEIDAIAISHLHADHVADLPVLAVARRYRPAGPLPAVPVWGPAGTDERLAQLAGKDPAAGTSEQLDVREWEPGTAVHVGPLTLEPVAMNHSLPCFGVRVTGPAEAFAPDEPGTPAGAPAGSAPAAATSPAGPATPATAPSSGTPRLVTLAYTGDTDSGPGLDALATDVDLLLAEAAFHEGRDDAFRGIHLTARRAAQAATRGGTRHLVLTHIPAWNDPAVALEEARSAYTGRLTLATPGATFTL